MYNNLLPNEPVLMPYQARPLNNDTFAAEEFIKLRDKFNIDTVIELGSCVGGTTNWLAKSFREVHTIEIEQRFQEFAKQRCAEHGNIKFHLGSTVDVLAGILSEYRGKPVLLFVDSHWGDHFPLFDELDIIRDSGVIPIIIVHDCKVPGEPALGYDSYKGVDISYDQMEFHLNSIYGKGKFDHHYNSDAKSTDVKRGIIYIYPSNNGSSI